MPDAMTGQIDKAGASIEFVLFYRLQGYCAVGDASALCRTMYALAQLYWDKGQAESAAEILAFVMLQRDLPSDIEGEAEALFAEIEGRICPRVILDARTFAAEMDSQTMIEYLMDERLN